MNSNRFHPLRARKLAALAVAAGAFMAGPALAAGAYVAPIGSGEGADPYQQAQMTRQATPMPAPMARAQAPTMATPMTTTMTPVTGTPAPAMTAEVPTANPTTTFTPASTVGPLSRAEVREALVNWRNAGILVPANEIGDTNETLAAREAFNDMQAEAINARWALESQRMAQARDAAYAAQLARDEIEAVLTAARREEPAPVQQ
jgi:hypothetical protein